ncbi:MAG: AMP-binding protein [Acidobacteria bacterium]|nr:MAG: AMP-binding protein [Acidobacteriota bacterium]
MGITRSYVHGPSHIPLLGETIGECLDRITVACGERDALISCHQRVRYTYSELHREAERIACGLLALGVEPGDRVGIWSPNCAEWLIAQYALAKVGAITVNINPAYRLRELEYALQQSGVSVLIAARRFRDGDYVAMLNELAPKLPSLRTVVYLGPDREQGGITWHDLAVQGESVAESRLRERESALQFDDSINIQYTSGTTGAPKGATLSHHSILNNGFFVGERLRYTTNDRICLPVPFYHCFGCVLGSLAALTHGSAIVLPAESFDAEACLRAVQEERCTSLYGVPTMFIAQLEHPAFSRYRIDSLRTGIMAGAPCPIDVMRQVTERMHMPEVTICYGMTETSPVSFQSSVDDPLEARVATVGTVHPHIECKIVDPRTGAAVLRGEPGELCTRGYSVMLGYWNDPEATALAIDSARWMHSGDLAAVREDGYVNIVGRLKDMIIRGGENIYPREIEEFLHGHPKIGDVQVIGVPDSKYGEEVCAWIRLREGETATQEEIRDYCRGQIATYKIPRYIRFTTEFPMTVTGKIQKFRLREQMIQELGLTTEQTA